MTEPDKQPVAARVLALDALRGLAILMMCLSGIVPEGLPNWMYHGYYPRFLPDASGVWQAVADPHTHRWQWSSFTWVDWVFPMFLFAMGAAFPLALGRRLDKGASVRRVVLGIFGRGLTLIGFAVYVRQITPSFIEYPTSPATWCLGLSGFALLFPVLARLPRTWSAPTVRAVRLVGLALCVSFVFYLNRGDGDAFSFAHNDIIILLLAHMAIAGSLVWLVSRRRLWLRLAFLVVPLVAHDMAMYSPDDPGRNTLLKGAAWLRPWVDWPDRLLDLRWLIDVLPWNVPVGVLDLSPLYDFTWYKFLLIVIPGTVVGDLLCRAMKRDVSPTTDEVRTGRLLGLSGVIVGLIAVVMIGLHCYGRVMLEFGAVKMVTPWVTWLGVVPLLAGGWVLLSKNRTVWPPLVAGLYHWGALWLVLGLAVDPLEVGITKGPPVTLSYLFVSLGASVLLLGALTIWIDVLGYRRVFSLFVLNGQNPMLAYVGIRNLLAPLVMLPLLAPFALDIGDSLNALMRAALPGAPWAQFVWPLIQTGLLAVLVAVFMKMRVVWRS